MERLLSLLRKHLISSITSIVVIFPLIALWLTRLAGKHSSNEVIYRTASFFVMGTMIWLIVRLVRSYKKFVENETQQKQQRIDEKVSQMTVFAEKIGAGDFNVELTLDGQADGLSKAMLAMRDKLRDVNRRDEQRRFTNEGLSQLIEILRTETNTEELYHRALAFVIKYLNANQGGIFLLKNDAAGTEYMEMVACYAFNKRKFLKKRFEKNEGLTGQAIIERETIYLTKVPQNYVNIRSGLGTTTPGCLLIVPLKYNDRVYGALELASFHPFEKHIIYFVERVAENLASEISSLVISEQTQEMLTQAQDQAEQMRAQEEEMRQNMEELQATQEEMERKEREHLGEINRLEQLHQDNIHQAEIQAQKLEDSQREMMRISNEMQIQLRAIDLTMFIIEFDTKKQVMRANKNFLEISGYNLNEIKTLRHKDFIFDGAKDIQDYENLWAKLIAGELVQGTFRRKDRNGNDIWLDGVYTPIFGEDGVTVIRIMKIARNVSGRKKMEQQLQSQMQEMKATEEELHQNMEEMKAMQEVVANNEARFKSILKAAGYMVITSSLEGMITSFNPAAERALGYKAEELVGRENPGIFHDPNEVVAVSAELSQELGYTIEPGPDAFHTKPSKGEIFEREWTYIAKDKHRIPVRLSIAPIYDANNKLSGYVGMAVDISDTKLAQQELNNQKEEILQQMEEMKATQHTLKEHIKTAQSMQSSVALAEQRNKALIEQITEAAMLTDTEGNILVINAVAQELTGYPMAEIQGKSFAQTLLDANELSGRTLLYESEHKKTARSAMEVLANKADAQWTIRTRKGKTLQPKIKVSVISNAQKEAAGYVILL